MLVLEKQDKVGQVIQEEPGAKGKYRGSFKRLGTLLSLMFLLVLLSSSVVLAGADEIDATLPNITPDEVAINGLAGEEAAEITTYTTAPTPDIKVLVRPSTLGGNISFIAQWYLLQEELGNFQSIGWDGASLKPEPVSQGSGITAPSAWAFFNLLLCVTGMALIIALFVAAYLRMRQESDEAKKKGVLEKILAKRRQEEIAKLYSENNFAQIIEIVEAKNRREKKLKEKQAVKEVWYKRRRTVWLVLAVLLGIVGMVVFALTADIRTSMTLVDQWTVVFAIVLLFQVMSAVIAFKDKKVPAKAVA